MTSQPNTKCTFKTVQPPTPQRPAIIKHNHTQGMSDNPHHPQEKSELVKRVSNQQNIPKEHPMTFP